MPACVAAATHEASSCSKGNDRRKKLWRTPTRSRTACGTRLPHREHADAHHADRGRRHDAVYLAQGPLRKYGIWASAVLYPAVPIGTSILRVIPTAKHTLERHPLLPEGACRPEGREMAGRRNGGIVGRMNGATGDPPVRQRARPPALPQVPVPAGTRAIPTGCRPCAGPRPACSASRPPSSTTPDMATLPGRRDGRVVGRIAAIVNRAHNEHYGDQRRFLRVLRVRGRGRRGGRRLVDRGSRLAAAAGHDRACAGPSTLP